MCFIYLLKCTRNGLNINHNGILYMVLDRLGDLSTNRLYCDEAVRRWGREGGRKEGERESGDGGGIDTGEKREIAFMI